MKYILLLLCIALLAGAMYYAGYHHGKLDCPRVETCWEYQTTEVDTIPDVGIVESYISISDDSTRIVKAVVGSDGTRKFLSVERYPF